jgi:prephenate dehydrogenase
MRIAILGAGRMGAWLTEELCWNNEVMVHDSDLLKMKYFIKVHRALSIEEFADFKPELFINCVPLGLTIEAFDTVLPYLPSQCIISDIASVKTGFREYYENCGHPFVSSHPMFGPTLANIRDLHEESAIIISESSKEGADFFRRFYSSLKICIFEYSFEEHDKTVAYSLATPFASTMVFAACMKKQDAPGTNFKRHLAIAKGLLSEDDRLLTEIMFNPYTIRQLELINSKLAYMTHIIRQRDYDEMKKFLDKLRANIGQ